MHHLQERVAPLEALEGVRPPVLGMGQRLRTLEASVTEPQAGLVSVIKEILATQASLTLLTGETLNLSTLARSRGVRKPVRGG